MKEKISNFVKNFKRSPLVACGIALKKINIDIFPYIDAKLKDSSKALGFDPNTSDPDVLARFVAAFLEAPSSKSLESVESFLSHAEIKPFVSEAAAQELQELFNTNGSDKSSTHDYHLVYQPILKSLSDKHQAFDVAEIGIGSNNLTTQFNMGFWGVPGASLRAFRDFGDSINVYGADIDSTILFTEDRISTQQVDQFKPKMLASFLLQLQGKPCLLIDDGMHALRANMNVFIAFMDAIKSSNQELPERWLVIEDVGLNVDITRFWMEVVANLSVPFHGWVVNTKHSNVVVIKYSSCDH